MNANTNFKAGDKVSFTIVRSCGRGFRFSSRDGVIQELVGNVAWVKYRGRIYDCEISEIRKLGEKSALAEAFENMGS